MRFSATGRTHVGLVRSGNEDSGFAGPTLLLVADGVGGNAAGEVASATTAYVVSASALARVGLRPASVLGAAVAESQRQVRAGVQRDPSLSGMSTTMTALLTDGQRFAMAHVGDSRAYLFRDGGLSRLSTDHTWVQSMQDEGRMSAAEAHVHPWRNVVLRTINADDPNGADVLPLALRLDDRVLVCSDGLTDLVSEGWIEQILGSHAGGRDNITCVLGTVVDGPGVVADGLLLGAVVDPSNIVDPTAVRHSASA
jgi:serine/threonine protein phosphatase PrpC